MPEQKQEEFEVIPLSPLRKLEKRIDQLETSSAFDANSFFKELIDIVKMNQQIVDEMAKANDSLRIELSRLPGRLEEVCRNLNELISYIQASTGEEGTESSKAILEKLEQIVETNKKVLESNQSLVSTMEEIDRKLRRPPAPMPPLIRRPLPTLVK